MYRIKPDTEPISMTEEDSERIICFARKLVYNKTNEDEKLREWGYKILERFIDTRFFSEEDYMRQIANNTEIFTEGCHGRNWDIKKICINALEKFSFAKKNYGKQDKQFAGFYGFQNTGAETPSLGQNCSSI